MRIASVDSNDSTAGKFSPMATLTIRNLDDAVRDQLRRRAAEHGHSMEGEVRQIRIQLIRAWWEELEQEGHSNPRLLGKQTNADEGRLQAHPGNCTNCIIWPAACQSSDGQLYPGQGLVFEAVEHSCRSVQAPEEINRLCRIATSVSPIQGMPRATTGSEIDNRNTDLDLLFQSTVPI